MDRALPDSLSQKGTRGVVIKMAGQWSLLAALGHRSRERVQEAAARWSLLERVWGTVYQSQVTTPSPPRTPSPPNPRRPARESQAPTALPTGFHGNGSSLQGGLGHRAGSSEKPQISLLFIFLHSHLFSEPEFSSVLMF